MPAELTRAQLDELRRALRADRERLEQDLQLSRAGAQPVELETPIGRLSRMDAIQQQQMTRASRSTLEIRLLQVKASLDAFAKDEYGVCRACDEPIGYARLRARPEAPYCLRCQGQRDP